MGRIGWIASALVLLIQPLVADEIPDPIQQILDQRVEQGYAVGLSVAIVDRNGVRFYNAGTYGLDDDRPITEETLFEIGSVTKTFTTLLLVEAVCDGGLTLTDPVALYLPPKTKIPQYRDKAITLEHLATHTSGLPAIPNNVCPQCAQNPFADYTPPRLWNYLAHCQLPYEPGTHCQYSHTGIGLLGIALAYRAKTSYEDLVVEHIAKPLQMQSTVVTLTPELSERTAKGHAGGQKVSSWEIPTLVGAAGLHSSTQDMSKYLRAQLGLSCSRLHPMMFCTQLPRFRLSERVWVALGWPVDAPTGSISHTGQTGGYQAFIGFLPSELIGVVVLSNTNDQAEELGIILLEQWDELNS